MLFVPTIAGQLSGSIGAVVASHNAGGQYFRLRVTPTNPNTPQQIQVRTQFALLTVFWQTGLTQLDRDAWELYAENVKVTNRIGAQVNISGLSMFVRNNTARVQIGLAIRIAAPTIFNIGSFTAATISNATAALQTVDVNFSVGTLSDPWANEAGSFLLVWLGRPQNSNINYFRGPYRFAGSIQGDPIPPATPFTVATQFPFVAQQKIFATTRVIYGDGRYTTEARSSIIAGI